MKIAFNGLKGFTEKETSVNLSEITVLTGKNSSGKSSFNKLLNLIFSSFKNIKSLGEIFDIKIDIGNEKFGGKKNLQTYFSNEKNFVKFEIKFAFFKDEFEIYLHFDINEYTLYVSLIELFKINSNSKIKRLKICEWNSHGYKFDANLLRKLYLNNVRIFNLTEILYVEKNYNESYSDDWQLEINKFKNKKEIYIDVDLELCKDQDSKDEIDDIVSDNNTKEDFLPFDIFISDWSGEFYLLNDNLFDFNYKKNDVKSLLPKDDINYRFIIQEISKEDYTQSDLINLLIKMYKLELSNYSLDNFENYSRINVSQRLINIYHNFRDDDLFRIINDIDSEYFPGLYFDVFGNFFPYIDILVGKSKNIFEAKIIKQFKEFAYIENLNNKGNNLTRNFNAFNVNSIYSTFIKSWSVYSVNNRNFSLAFLKKYIKKFEIADDIKIELKDNIGFITLIKKNNSITIIDEGTGISNILALLLFLANSIFKKNIDLKNKFLIYRNDDDILPNGFKKILIFEEPEINLHPSLQSKLADLFVEIHNEYNYCFVIETHSEYLIRKLQYLVSTGMITHNKISINYFSLFNKNKMQLIKNDKILLNNRGQLSNEFGPGFFDESNNLAIDLFIVNNKFN